MSVFSFSIHLLQNLVLKQRPFSVDSCCLGTTKSIMASKCTQILGAFDRSVPGCSFGFVISVWLYDVRTPWERGCTNLPDAAWINWQCHILKLFWKLYVLKISTLALDVRTSWEDYEMEENKSLKKSHMNGYYESYHSKQTKHVSRLRVLCIEVFKTLKNINPSFMHDIFKIKSSIYSSLNPNDLQHYRPNQVTFGPNSLPSLGPQI